jgi:hypothetical protein
MAVGFSNTNKPLNPRGQDASPKGYNRASLFSGKALDFDGVNDVVNVTTNDLDFGANDFSVSAIVHWSGSHTDGKLAYAERGSSGSQLAAWQIRTDGTGNMLFQANTVADGWQAVYFSGVEAIIADGLTHLTFVRVGTGATLYINGQFYSTGTGSIQATLDTPNGAFVIGNRIGSSNYWNGLVTQFKVYSTALTAEQVADLYNNPEKVVPTGVESNLKLWLPMMEGAGTTAYDGSGNGNHGTISGATYVNGIGAPVAQSAVMDWNKGNNILDYSNNFSQAYWLKLAAGGGSIPTITANYTTGPSGKNDASRLQASNTSGGGGDYSIVQVGISTSTTDAAAGVWVKSNTGSNQTIYFRADGGDQHSTALVTTEWTRIQKTGLSIASTIYSTIGLRGSATGTSSIDISIWGASLEKAANVGPYVYTNGTAQTSEVLLPQGLTTGRDITGVNLFENVRKQGALNLDGNSWAEVHDNASLDISPAMTMECWVDFSKIDSTAYRHFIVKPSGATWASPYARYALRGSNASVQWWFESAGFVEVYSVSLTGWNHIAVTKDGTAEILYINGAQVDTATNNATITASAENLLLGQATTGTEPLDSPIAQPRIYNRALTASEVLQNYNSGKNTYK